MLTPGLADLFEPVDISRPATHAVKILRNKGMVAVRQGKPIHVYRPLVTGIGSQRDPHAAIDCTIGQLHQVEQSADDDIGAGDSPDAGLVQCRQFLGFHIAVCVELCDVDGLHGCADRNASNQRTGQSLGSWRDSALNNSCAG